MKAYTGIFAELLTHFVAFKRSLGFKYDTVEGELFRFSKFSETFHITEPILTKDIVQAWNTKRPNEGVKTNARRVYTLRQFALYLNSLGLQAYIAPPYSNTRHYTFIPYIFTHNEIERIFTSCDQLFPRRNATLPLIVPVILRLLYSCGLRISEAISLQNKHVNLQEGILKIKNSKFGKDRLVPLSESMLQVCKQYFQVLHTYSSPEDYFFMKTEGQPIASNSVYKRFREVLWKSGISHGGKGKGPRMPYIRCPCTKMCSGQADRCILCIANPFYLYGTCLH